MTKRPPGGQHAAALAKRVRKRVSRKSLRHDAIAGVVLGVESVPDGLSFGFLAGVNPLAGLYGYLYGMVGGALLSSTSVMAVQVTGAMAIIVADTDLASHSDPDGALYTLAVLTGVIMIAAGLLRAGLLLRYVPRAVMVGFISGVGVNMVLGQLGNFTGYDASGSNRVLRTIDLVANFWKVDLPSVTVGVVTLVLIVVLQRTRLGALGMVVAVAVGSALAYWFTEAGHRVATVGDSTSLPRGLPHITAPLLGEMPGLMVPALALAFVGMVQGAGVSAAFPNPDGSPSKPSRDIVGQGAGSIVSGLFQGMPAGGSMSATALVVQAGARTRMALFIAAGVMAAVVVLAADAVGYVAFPALAALLIVIGVGTVKPEAIKSTIKTGPVQAAVLIVTFTLTIVIPVPQAVMAGVAIAVVLYVVEQSNRVVIKQLELDEHGHRRESDPPAAIPPGEVVILQPYGSLFFASAGTFSDKLPSITPATRHSVVILRLRGIDDLGVSVATVVVKYAADLTVADSRLFVNGGEQLLAQLTKNGILDQIGAENFYLGGDWHGKTLVRADAEARAWIAEQQVAADGP